MIENKRRIFSDPTFVFYCCQHYLVGNSSHHLQFSSGTEVYPQNAPSSSGQAGTIEVLPDVYEVETSDKSTISWSVIDLGSPSGPGP